MALGSMAAFLFSAMMIFQLVSVQAMLKIKSVDDTGLTALQLAKKLRGSSDIAIFNAKLSGNPRQFGVFKKGKKAVGMKKGVVLSSNDVRELVTGSDFPLTGPGDEDLDDVVNQDTVDAAALEFKFVPSKGKISMKYLFASSEYPSTGNNFHNDGLAIFVNGQNCALLPFSADPVSVNTVNEDVNSNYFVDDIHDSIKVDGMTTVLKCKADVQAGQVNTMKIVVGDGFDRLFRSAGFLQSGSFQQMFAGPGGLKP